MTDKPTDPPEKPRFSVVSNDATPAERGSPPGAQEDSGKDRPSANDEGIRLQITKLTAEHRDLDLAIRSLEERIPYDQLAIQRLKKRKLVLKDRIQELHEQILPDIIA